jgi:hypothetical protein
MTEPNNPRERITIEVDLKDIKNLLSALNDKIDVLLEDRDTLSFMV